jgi:TM2 domain-containing membrane protein YozV
MIKKDTLKQKKWVSALFAFPFPFGFMGAHRVMLGTKPWVPVVYVATFGGCFGLLPLIDFLVITFSKDITQYENNPNIFMWVKEKKEKEVEE